MPSALGATVSSSDPASGDCYEGCHCYTGLKNGENASAALGIVLGAEGDTAMDERLSFVVSVCVAHPPR